MPSKVFWAIRLARTGGVSAFLAKLRVRLLGLLSLLRGEYEHVHNGVLLDTEPNVFSTDIRGLIVEGKYEEEETELVRSHLRPNEDVIELGAGVGYVSALIDEILNGDAEQLCLEADERLVPVLQTTKKANDCDYTVVNSAYSTREDEVEFYLHSDFWGSSTVNSSGESVTVDTKSIRQLLNDHEIDTFQLVVDVEGGEEELITDELDVLRSRCVLLVLEFHDWSYESAEIGDYVEKLEEAGFEHVDSMGDTFVFENRTYADSNPVLSSAGQNY